jgi:arylsulfatase A-like enzyme
MLASGARAAEKPNILLIYADDIGYGDLSCYGATRVQTPRCDQLAREGLRFTDAHATAATCTPSRYSLLTGEYAFRKPGTNILPGDAGLIIAPTRTTLPAMLKRAGYSTAIVGKWHLGLGGKQGPDWNGQISPGPNEVGFDYSFIMPATVDRVPTVYVENGRVRNLDPADPITVSYKGPVDNSPTGTTNPELLKMKADPQHSGTIVNGVSRIGWMKGGKTALWNDEAMADTFAQTAISFLEKHDKSKPFFLYFAAHNNHVPRIPAPRFAGKTPMGPRGDSIAEFDDTVGQLLDALQRLHLDKNTLVILSSDNGPVINDGYADEAVSKLGDHKAAGPFHGGKYSVLEGGTRIPFLVRWPGRAKPGVSDALVSQIDLLASFAALVGQSLTTGDAPDSQNVLPALLGTSPNGRAEFVEEGYPSELGLRAGSWKYIGPRGNTPARLFDLATDPGESKNRAAENPDKAAEMDARLKQVAGKGEVQ